MHFLVSALGSAGDVLPFVTIAQALQARSHDVQVIAAAPFADRVEQAGIAFIALGTDDDYQRMVRDPDLWHPRRGARLMIDQLLRRLPEAIAVTEAAARPRTVLVGSSLSWGMRLVQEQRGLPGATVHLAPSLLRSALRPPVLPGGTDLSRLPPPVVRWLQWAGERFVLDRWIAPRLNRQRAGRGLPPVRDIWSRWMDSPDLVIGAWPAWFAAPAPDWPRQVWLAGFPLFDEGGLALDAELSAFLDAGAAPVGVTPGSAMAHGERFFARAIEACRAAQRRAVLVSPYRERLPRVLPAGCHHVTWAPFSRLLPRLSALIHHGGIGTCAQALAAGIPQLVVPFAYDQFDNAARLQRRGVGLTGDASAPAARWTATLLRLLDDPAVAAAARRDAQSMTDRGLPARSIAARLEQLGRMRH